MDKYFLVYHMDFVGAKSEYVLPEHVLTEKEKDHLKFLAPI